MAAFDIAFAAVVGEEGGYVNNPADPGGETKFGISKRAYPGVDIANLTLGGAKAIYQRDYWAKVSGDQLQLPIAFAAFDAAVNSGAGQAARWLQAAVGATPDGQIGPMTLAAVAKAPVGTVLVNMLAARQVMLTGLPAWKTFGLGWTRRILRVALAAQAVEGKAA